MAVRFTCNTTAIRAIEMVMWARDNRIPILSTGLTGITHARRYYVASRGIEVPEGVNFSTLEIKVYEFIVRERDYPLVALRGDDAMKIEK